MGSDPMEGDEVGPRDFVLYLSRLLGEMGGIGDVAAYRSKARQLECISRCLGLTYIKPVDFG